ncbi:hypothetical protein B0H66DRAFT_532319 [Apodospora peruviana]|uniref:Uncharacterized protein n=1 Tax=Apodospora peruviana TaxID=516989 RepID=A0AAE0IDK8_9PEZI|nr:hypothetical protein B0H66DRAFT_532319 [Apodospora peruviana]
MGSSRGPDIALPPHEETSLFDYCMLLIPSNLPNDTSLYEPYYVDATTAKHPSDGRVLCLLGRSRWINDKRVLVLDLEDGLLGPPKYWIFEAEHTLRTLLFRRALLVRLLLRDPFSLEVNRYSVACCLSSPRLLEEFKPLVPVVICSPLQFRTCFRPFSSCNANTPTDINASYSLSFGLEHNGAGTWLARDTWPVHLLHVA